ncbi:MAG: hypothetical protein LBQ48_06495 [Oscillospiraceae bacterium]|jgi:hypothetical protein|nr:hypothetical protein [Oscillospiraceae bacterium]
MQTITKNRKALFTGMIAVFVSAFCAISAFSGAFSIKSEALTITKAYYSTATLAGSYNRIEEDASAHYTVSGSGDNISYTRKAIDQPNNWTSHVPSLSLGSAKNFSVEFDYTIPAAESGTQYIWLTFGNASMNVYAPSTGSAAAGLGTTANSADTEWTNILFFQNGTTSAISNSWRNSPTYKYDGTVQHHVAYRLVGNVLTITLDAGAVVRTYNFGSIETEKTYTTYTGGYVGVGTGYKDVVLSNISFASLDGVGDTVYYAPNLITSTARTEKISSDYYNITQNNGKKTFTRNATALDGTSWVNSLPVAFVGSAVDFTLEFDYQLPVGSGEKWLWVTFGNDSKTAYTAGSVAAATGVNNSDSTLYQTYYRAKKQNGTEEITEWRNEPPYTFVSADPHHITYRMIDGVLTISLDNSAVVRTVNLDAVSNYSYTGGYVGFGTNVSGAVISDVLFTPLAVRPMITGAQIRTTAPQGLQFIASSAHDEINGYTLIGFGNVLLPERLYTSSTGALDIGDAQAKHSELTSGINLSAETLSWSTTIINIASSRYNDLYLARPYLIYRNNTTNELFYLYGKNETVNSPLGSKTFAASVNAVSAAING